LVDEYNGKPLTGSYHLTVGPSDKYLYFTSPESSSVYRIKLQKNAKTQPVVELVTKQVKYPTHVTFSTKRKNRAFVGNCMEGVFSVYVFEVNEANEKWNFVKEWNMESIQWNGPAFEGKVGCVRGILALNGKLLVTCPGNRICIIDEESGIMEAAVKMFDGVIMNDFAIYENRLYVASNFSVWRFFRQEYESKKIVM